MGPRIQTGPVPAESSLRPLEVSTHHASSAAAAPSFELRRVQRIGGPVQRLERRDQCLEAMSPERHYCGILVGRHDCGLRRDQHSFELIRWFWPTSAVLDLCSTPQCQVIRSRPRCDPYRRGQTDKQKAGAIATRDEVFLFLVVWQDGRRATFWMAVSAWNPCRKQKISINIVGEPSIGETMAGPGTQRHEAQESSKKMLQLVLEKNIFARAELQYKGANKKTRLYCWDKP